MSRAFVREPDGDVPPEPFPEIPVPPPPNPVTRRGLALIEQAITNLESQLNGGAGADSAEFERLRRELRYWTARQATAQLTHPPETLDAVGFGSRVTVGWPGRGNLELQIVGHDEADPSAGRIGWRAPVAAALFGNGPGDEVEVSVGGRNLRLAIVAVDNQTDGRAPT
jgi:transcription elongation GreA/GreB family factor